MEGRGARSSTTPAPPASSRSTRRPRRRTRCGCSAPACSASPSTASAWSMRDTGGGFGQKVMVQRDEMCLMLAAPKVGAPLKWVEDRRENLLAAGKSRHEHGDRDAWRSTPTARSRPRTSTSSDCGAYPTPWPVSTAAAVGMFFPGPYRVPRAGFADQGDLHEHRRAHRVPRSVAVRDARARGAARHRGAPHGHRPGRAAAPQPAAPRRAAVREPERHDLRQHLAARDVRAGARRSSTTTRSAPSRPTARAAGRYLGVGMSNYVEPSTPGFGSYAHRGGDDPHRAVGRGQRVHRRRLDREQPRDDRRPAHRRRARRAHRRRQHDPGRHRGHRLRRGRGREPQRVDDRGRGARDRDDPARAHRRDRRAQARGRRRRHRARREPGARPRHARRSASRSPRSPRSRTSSRTRCRPACPPGLEASARYTADAGVDLGERDARVHVRGRRRDRSASSSCATS